MNHTDVIRIAKVVYRNVNRHLKDPSLLYSRSNHPDFLIIGAQKSGTSSLFNWLNQHPQMRGSLRKELHYFNREIHMGRDLRWYRRQFPGKAALHFEATPAYMYQPTTVDNIHRVYPHVKLIAILRNPVDRAYSAYNHHRSNFAVWRHAESIKNRKRLPGNRLYASFFEDRDAFPSFRECIDIELDLSKSPDIYEPSLLRRGHYASQLQHIEKRFGSDQLLILGFKDLTERTVETLDRVCRFLGVESLDWSRQTMRPMNQRPYAEGLSSADRAFLESYYSQPNQLFFETYGNINW